MARTKSPPRPPAKPTPLRGESVPAKRRKPVAFYVFAGVAVALAVAIVIFVHIAQG